MTGEPLVALYLSQFDPNWLEGRMGEWIDHYHRPDVFAMAKAKDVERKQAESMNLRDFTRAEWAKAKGKGATEKAEADNKGHEGSV